MKRRHILLAVLLTVSTGVAWAHFPGGRNVPAERLVGAWSVDVAIGPCSLPDPVAFFSAYNTFHAGGTLSDANWAPPSSRGPGHGVWRYVGKRRYESTFRFFRYDNPQPSQASGVQEVKVRITLDADGQGYTGDVDAQQMTLDGSPVGPALCGQAIGTRVGL